MTGEKSEKSFHSIICFYRGKSNQLFHQNFFYLIALYILSSTINVLAMATIATIFFSITKWLSQT